MIKKMLFAFLLILVAISAWAGIARKDNTTISTPEPLPVQEITYINSSSDLINVELPFPGAVTGKEFSVIGKARGYWFFEASFPLELLDQDGNVIATGYAQAEGEWMTEDFVPFKGEIKAPDTYIGPATLVLHKDNASGEPDKDASVSFPITIEY
jgi:hypothetical protein